MKTLIFYKLLILLGLYRRDLTVTYRCKPEKFMGLGNSVFTCFTFILIKHKEYNL